MTEEELTAAHISALRIEYPLIRHHARLYPLRRAWLESTAAENAEMLAISDQIKAGLEKLAPTMLTTL